MLLSKYIAIVMSYTTHFGMGEMYKIQVGGNTNLHILRETKLINNICRVQYRKREDW